MLISPDFVMLNYPRTGSSFTRKVLKQIYATNPGRPLGEMLLPNIRVLGAGDKIDHHGTYAQIPTEHASKPVFSIARDPCTRLVSLFRYRFWASSTPIPHEIIIHRFPTFPDIDIDDYIEFETMALTYRLGFEFKNVSIGHQSVQFIQMFFKKPKAILASLSDAYIDSDAIFDDIGCLEFLRQEHLRSDLKRLLIRFDHPQSDVAMIDLVPSSNVSAKDDSPDSSILSRAVRNRVAKLERLIYRIYERKGIHYS